MEELKLNKPKIIKLKELFNLNNLKIPDYQRPYSWSKDSVNTLFSDIFEACKEKKEKNLYDYEYRLGTVVLHKEKDANENIIYNIVDGQQRITTIIMLLDILDKNSSEKNNKIDIESLLEETKYPPLSVYAIRKNYNILISNVNSLKNEKSFINIKDYKEFLLEYCSFVKIELEELTEAFQFFDSQNARGKDLNPHDLLKAYHLREMNNIDKKIKIDVIEKWEGNYEENDLKTIFNENLYPLVRWYKGKDGLYFDKSKIKNFKGIREKDTYKYALYHKFVQEYIDETNKGFGKLLFGKYKLFQLTQEILAGEKFFDYVFYYDELAKRVDNLINDYNKKWVNDYNNRGIGNSDANIIPETGEGDRYIKILFKNILMFWADKFSFEDITEVVFNKLFCWCYKLRIGMQAVYLESINKYALGNHDLNKELNFFEFINNIKHPKEINTIYIEKPQKKYNTNEKEKYKRLYEKITELCGWDK